MLIALPHALGVVWRAMLAGDAATRAIRESGVVPILARIVLEGGEGPVSVDAKMEASGTFDLSHVVGPDGRVERILANMWAELTALRGRTYGPPPAGAGERIVVGRVYAEHVFTRIFAPPGERKVVRLEAPGLPPVPERVQAWRAPEAVVALPPDATPIDAAPVPDDTTTVFGIAHTDSNQHVNSLVYPQLFEDAALRRLADRGRSTAQLLARRAEIGWRRPCFAGERVRWLLQAFEHEGALAVSGTLVDDADRKPRCYVQMRFG